MFSTLVDAATLGQHLDDPDWRVFDVRHQLADPAAGERGYAAGHLPGAHFLHCDRDLSGPMSGQNGRHPLPDPQALAGRLGACGVGGGTQVVVYDDSQGAFAGRLWWLLRWLGHRRVAVLDGGLQAWLAAGGTLSAVPPPVRPPRFSPAPDGEPAVDADAVLAGLVAPSPLLVDARSPERFRGECETLDPVGGRIPGARSRFFRDNLTADGRFKPAAELRADWLAVLAGRDAGEVVHYCGSGVTACHNLLAMEIAGLPGSRLYAGSWSEWCADPGRPVACGPG